MKGKRLEQSHLTWEEQKEAIKYGVVATVLIAVGITFGLFGWINPFLAELVTLVGGMLVAFIWGYVGALEAERSGKA